MVCMSAAALQHHSGLEGKVSGQSSICARALCTVETPDSMNLGISRSHKALHGAAANCQLHHIVQHLESLVGQGVKLIDSMNMHCVGCWCMVYLQSPAGNVVMHPEA